MSRGDLGEVLGDLGALWGGLGAILGGLGALLGGLGAILGGLGRSWGRLGAGIFGRPWGSKMLIFQLFLNVFVIAHFFQKISLQDPSWTELGQTWDDFGTQNGANMAPKSDPKTIPTRISF